MAVNKSKPLSHQAGALAALHAVTPNLLQQQAAQGARPSLPGPVNSHTYTSALLLPVSAPLACPIAAGEPGKTPGLSSSLPNTVFLERRKT